MPSAPVVRLCWRCRQRLLPTWRTARWPQDTHRAAARGMVEVDPRAEAIRQRKERKRILRDIERQLELGDLEAALKAMTFAGIVPTVAEVASEECADCQALQRRAVA